jgi:hypothetical protein
MKPAPMLAPLLGVVLCLAASLRTHAGDEWKPVDPAHLNLKAPAVEKDADAEVLFWEVKLQDEADGGDPRTVLRHHVRIKIFTERGKESQSTVDLWYDNGTDIKDIAARTIKPDGTVIELKKEAVFEQTKAKLGRRKLKAKSFAMPGVEPGCIIEYRYREIRKDTLSMYERLHFQREIPVQFVKYYIKPISLPGFPYGMRTITFNGNPSPMTKEQGGFYSTSMTNVPAFREEPRMPPEDQVRAWMLIYYSEDKKLDAQGYWKSLGKEAWEENKGKMKVNDDVKRAAAEAVGDAATPDEKLARILAYCRTRVKNVYDDTAGFTSEQRKKLKDNNSPADTLKRGYGVAGDIDRLFAALAAANGFDARVAYIGDRSDKFFDASFPDRYFLRYSMIAVKVGEEWKFYDPSNKYVPAGMLAWEQEGQQALLSDPKEPVFIPTPLSKPEKSMQKSTGKLKLGEDGTLEGDVRIEMTGHLARLAKEGNDEKAQPEREEALRGLVKRHMSTAEVSDIRIEANLDDAAKPFVYAFRVKVPGYAQRTGKRLFLQPAFFQYGDPAVFTTSERKHAVYFHYAWTEDDAVEIELPAGFALDNAEAPQPFNANDIVKYDVSLATVRGAHTLVYKRKLTFDGLLFPVTSYPSLKQVFDLLHKQDGHTVTLKQAAATASKD